MSYAETLSKSPPPKHYSIKDITVIICIRLTKKNPWIIDRLALYSTWFTQCPQIIVVDFGSDNSYANTLKVLCNSHDYHYWYEDNKGVFSLSQARNIGFSESKTDLVFFTDPDFIYERDIFQRLLKIANALDMRRNSFNRITMPAYHLSQSYSKSFEENESTLQEKENQLIQWMHHGVYTEYNQVFEYISPYSNNFFCHRHFYDLVGGYSTDFVGHGSEDFEFIIRSNLLRNTLPLPENISMDVYKPNELDSITPEYKGFRKLAEVETFSAELHGFRSFHLWHPRLASTGWYENNDRKRTVFNSVLSRYINNKVDLLKEDYLPRNKKALCIISNESQLIDFLPLRLAGYSLDVLSNPTQIKEKLDSVKQNTYQEIIYYDQNIEKEFSLFLDKVGNSVKTTCLMKISLPLNMDNFDTLIKDYQYSSNSYAARRLHINTQNDLKKYVQTTKSQLSFWQKGGSRIFSFAMSPFLSSFHKTQLKNDPKLFFNTAKHPFSVWIGRKLRLKN